MSENNLNYVFERLSDAERIIKTLIYWRYCRNFSGSALRQMVEWYQEKHFLYRMTEKAKKCRRSLRRQKKREILWAVSSNVP